jgi:hypothetical protein
VNARSSERETNEAKSAATESEGGTLLDIVRAQNPLRNPRAFPPDVISTCLHVDPRTLLALSVTSKSLRALVTRDVVLRSLLESDGARFLARVSEPLRAESLGAVCPMPPLRLLRLALASRCENCFVDAEHLRCFLQVVVVVEKALNPTNERLLVQLRNDPDHRGPLRRSAAKLLSERHARDAAWVLRNEADEAAARAAAAERTPWASVASNSNGSSSATTMTTASASSASSPPPPPPSTGNGSPNISLSSGGTSTHWLPERSAVSESEIAAHKVQKKLNKKWTSVENQRYLMFCDHNENSLAHLRTIETRLALPRDGGETEIEFRILFVSADSEEPVVVGPEWRRAALRIDPSMQRVGQPSSFIFTVSCSAECPNDAPPTSDLRAKQVDALVETASITDDALFLCAPCTKLLKAKLYPEDRHFIQAVERNIGLHSFIDEGNDTLHESLYETTAHETAGSLFNIDIVRRLRSAPRGHGEERLERYVQSIVGDHGERSARLANFALLRARLPVLFGDDEVAAFVDGMKAKDEMARFRAVQGLRRHLSRTQRPPISEAIAYGALPPLVSFLSDDHDTSMQFEAAWSLTNVASGSHAQTMAVVQHDAHIELVRLLSSQASNVAEQSIWAVGNISGDSPVLRDLIIDTGALPPLLRLIDSTFTTGNLSMQRNGVWALSNLLRGRPPPARQCALDAAPAVVHVVRHSNDLQSQTDALWALAYTTDILSDKFEPVLTDIAQTVTFFLSERGGPLKTENNLLVPSLRALGNMIAGCQLATQAAIDQGAIAVLMASTQHERASICKESFWALSNVCAGTIAQIEAAIGAGILQLLVRTMKDGHVSTATLKEIFWCACNIVTDGSTEQVEAVVAAFDGPKALLETFTAAGFFEHTVAESALREFYNRNVVTLSQLSQWLPDHANIITNNFTQWQDGKARKVTGAVASSAVTQAIANARAQLPPDAGEDESWKAIVAALEALPHRAVRDGEEEEEEEEEEEADGDADDVAPMDDEDVADGTDAAPAVTAAPAPAASAASAAAPAVGSEQPQQQQ